VPVARSRDGGLYFVVDTIRDSTAEETERALRSSYPINNAVPNNGQYTSSYYNPSSPIHPRLATPNPYDTYSTPSTMSPLFPSYASSINSAHPDNFQPANTDQNYYPAPLGYPVNSYTNYPNSGYPYPVPGKGEAPYFNPSHNSMDTNHTTIGLNDSNENVWRNTYNDSVDWNQLRNNVERNITERYLEDRRGISDKEVVFSPIMSNEIEINKSGILGKLKLAVKYIDTKITNSMSNIDSIVIKYHDITKRKFFWTLWERKSGSYESYQDFKQSWDPKTSIWDEIKKRTRKDVQADVEGILGITRNIRGLDYSVRRGIAPTESHIQTEVNNLVRNTEPFSRPIENIV